MENKPGDGGDRPPPQRQSPSRLNLPNLLGVIRLTGSGVLIAVAWWDQLNAFLLLFVFLLLTDWIDGKLAVMLDQRTTFGARLDSVADAAMYAALLFGAVWFRADQIAQEVWWIAAAVASYALTSAAGLLKYGRVPSYHTRLAKSSWLFVSLGAVMLFTGWSMWPLRVAMVFVTLTNLEAAALTFVLPQWEADVPSLLHVLRRGHGESRR